MFPTSQIEALGLVNFFHIYLSVSMADSSGSYQLLVKKCALRTVELLW